MFNVQGQGVYSEELHLYGKIECMSTNRSKEGGAQEVFNLTSFIVCQNNISIALPLVFVNPLDFSRREMRP